MKKTNSSTAVEKPESPVAAVIAAALGQSGQQEPLIVDRFDTNAGVNTGLAMRLNKAYQTAMAVSGIAEIARAHYCDGSPIYKALQPRHADALLNAITLLGDAIADDLDELADRL